MSNSRSIRYEKKNNYFINFYDLITYYFNLPVIALLIRLCGANSNTTIIIYNRVDVGEIFEKKNRTMGIENVMQSAVSVDSTVASIQQ